MSLKTPKPAINRASKKASYFATIDGNRVRCTLCPHQCIIAKQQHGICLTRGNHDGVLYTENYCSPVSIAIDPIEKKPLYHFNPGSSIFSTGPNGCNFKCSFCQNYEISQNLLPTHELSCDDFLQKIVQSKTIGIAYTYSEPYIWFETIMDIGTKIKELGMVNVMVTNGSMCSRPLDDLLQIIDAMNIDIKSMNPLFYKKFCKAELMPVLETCEEVKKKCHLEITNLLITDENDSDDDIKKLSAFIAENLGNDTPLHLSRYFPRYRLKNKMTTDENLFRAYDIAKERLDNVYLGNITATGKANTICSGCNTLLINRDNNYVEISSMLNHDGNYRVVCRNCNTPANIIFSR